MITETFMGDYEEVDGYIFAHTISQKMGGQVVFSLTIDKIEIDKELEEDLIIFSARFQLACIIFLGSRVHTFRFHLI